ncbi:hypothetical protein QQ045_018500 [Rhodiola kirilowii]
MVVQKTVLKVDISCDKCKKKILKAITGLQGVDKIEIDAAKGTITVTGNADPYEIIVQERKAGRFAEVVTIGPPPAPEKDVKKDEKKDDKKDHKKADTTSIICHHPRYIYHMMPVEDQQPLCSIL